jgi:hypothetical protein
MRALISFAPLALVVATVAACGGFAGPVVPTRAPLAEQWFARAKLSYKAGDFDDAHDSVEHAINAAPRDPELRILAARVALTRLDFPEALKLTEGLKVDGPLVTEVHGIRGRAFWYGGDIDQAADELEAMLTDPSVKDPWAHDVAVLARKGSGRHPFEMDGSVVAASALLQGIDRIPFGPAHIVQIELEGDPVLAMIATGVSEVMIDSNARKDPAWVSLRFANRIEVKDVPALTQDLSSISRQIGVPIKALLGVNLLRHVHATFDRRGEQFIVRRQDPPPPPEASRVPVWYLRGGGMTLHGMFTANDKEETPLLVDSTRMYLLALSDETWKKAGVDITTLTPLPEAPTLKKGVVPSFKIGGFDFPRMPAVEGPDMAEVQAALDVDLGGIVGAELLSFFRVTFADEGRFIWIEADPTLFGPSPNAKPMPPTTTGQPMTPDPETAPPATSTGVPHLAPLSPAGAPPNAPMTTPPSSGAKP